MTDSKPLSAAHAVLLAIHLCAGGSPSSLSNLQTRFPATLTTERLLRIILTFLPESTDPDAYVSVVRSLVDAPNTSSSQGVDVSPVQDVPEAEARKRVRKIRLLPLMYPGDEDCKDVTDPLTLFLIHRAHRIDAETSLQPLILDLLLPFYQRSPILRTWLVSCLLPLLRLNYEYYPHQDKSCSVETLDALDEQTAVNILLSMVGTRKNDADLIQNLRGLIGPWMYGISRPRRRRLSQAARRNSISLSQPGAHHEDGSSGWEQVNEWLLSRSLVDPEAVVNAFVSWDGPEDVDLGGYDCGDDKPSVDQLKQLRNQYGQTGLAVVYQSSQMSLNGSIRVLERIQTLLELEGPTFDGSALPFIEFDASPIESASRATLFQNALLVPGNPLTYPSSSSLSFLGGLVLSLRALDELGHSISCRTASNICLHSNADMQLLELRSVMASIARTRPGDWRAVRQKLLWVRNWKSEAGKPAKNAASCHGLFYRIPLDVMEAEILKFLLEVRGMFRLLAA